MDSAPSPRDELRELLAQLAAGQISAVGIARIDELVRGDLQLRRLYIEQMRLVADLEFAYGQERLRPPAAIAQFPADASPTPANQPSPAAQPVKSPVLGFLGGVVDYVSHSRRIMFVIVAVMLSGWFIFQVGSVLLGRWWAGNADVADRGAEQPGVPKPAAGGPASTHGNALAWLSGSVGGRWQIAANSPTIDPATGNPSGPVFWELGTEFHAGQKVNLVAGLGEITFRSGAKVVISAPAQFSVTSALATDLQLGKLTARVPHDSSNSGPSHRGGTGFTVNTPEGSVVDVGTEFGVEVTPEHKVDVQVFVGEVKVSAPSGGAGPGDSGEPGVHVTAGKTVHLEPGKAATVVESKDKDRFQRDLTIASDSADKQQAAYLDLMRQLKPVVWLRMEGNEGDKTLHDEVGNVDAKLFWDGPGNPFAKGAVGKALWLRGPQLKDCAILPDYPKAEHGKLSVSAWVYADSRPTWATIVRNWGKTINGQFYFGLHNGPGGHGLDLAVNELREGESHPFPLHEWQHVAFVSDGTMLRLYREGREVAAMKYSGPGFPTPIRALGIGVRTSDSGTFPGADDLMYWDGKLDEIALFNDALSPEDIKKLAAAPPR